MWVTRDKKSNVYIWNTKPIKNNLWGIWTLENFCKNFTTIDIPDHEKWKNVKWSDSEATRLTDGLEIGEW